MLQLINYDLQDPDKNYPELQAGVTQAGGGIHILNGPWVYGADKSPQELLKAVTTSLEELNGDKLLVFPVQMGEIGNCRNLDQHDAKLPKGNKVYAITYTLRNPPGPFYQRPQDPKSPDYQKELDYELHRGTVTQKLGTLGKVCHPLGSLWFVRTKLSAHEVYLAIEKAVPFNPKDELMVVEVDLKVKGADWGLETDDHDWLVEAGVLAKVH